MGFNDLVFDHIPAKLVHYHHPKLFFVFSAISKLKLSFL